MGERVLFILAGLAGVGKTSLLHRALTEKLPIFGEAYNDRFQLTAKADVYPEERLSLSDRIERGTWLDVAHIVKSRDAVIKLNAPVIHFELFWFFIYLWQVDPDYRENIATPEHLLASLRGTENNGDLFKAFFQQHLFNNWDKVVVHTLYRPYDEVASDWRRREERLARMEKSSVLQFVSRYIYNMSSDGECIYEALYQGWINAIQASGAELHIFSRTFKDRMVYKTL